MHRLDDALAAFAARKAEGRRGQERHARREAEPLGDAGGLDRDVGELLGSRHFVHTGVGGEDHAALGEDHQNADGPLPHGRVEYPAHVVEHGGIVARDAGDHGVGVAGRQHRSGIDIAVVGDQPHAVAVEGAAPLQPFVKRVDVGRGFGRGMRHADLQRDVAVESGILDGGLDDIFAAHQNGLAQPRVLKRGCRTDDAFFFAFGEDHPLGIGADTGRDLVEQGGGGVQPRRQPVAVIVEVLELAARHAGFDRGLGNGGGQRPFQMLG